PVPFRGLEASPRGENSGDSHQENAQNVTSPMRTIGFHFGYLADELVSVIGGSLHSTGAQVQDAGSGDVAQRLQGVPCSALSRRTRPRRRSPLQWSRAC